MKVLVVEDDNSNRKLVRKILEMRGCNVKEAQNGREGLELAETAAPDLIISDAMMPVMDGFQFLMKIKRNENLKQIPFVFYSGFYTGREERELALAVGADAFITKPRTPDDLWKELQLAMDRRGAGTKDSGGPCQLKDDTDYIMEYASIVTAKLSEKVVELEGEVKSRKEVEKVLRESEGQYRLLFERNPMPMWVYDGETLSFLAVNDAAVRHYGYSRHEFLGMTIRDILPPGDVPALLDNVSAVTHGPDETGVWRHCKKDGTIIFVKIISNAFTFSGLRVELVMARDVTESRKANERIARLNRIYSMLSRINETIVRVRDRDQLFAEVCRVSVEVGRLSMVWVGLLDADTLDVLPVAYCGREEGYLQKINIASEELPESNGPVGRALREGKYFVCSNIELDECMLPWRDKALKCGYRSLAAFPLRSGERLVGAVSFYSSTSGFFDEAEMRLLAEVAEDTSFAIEFIEKDEQRRKAEEELRERVSELEKFYEMAVGRELKMKQLKEENAGLAAKLAGCEGSADGR